jgi:hypothetical protein
MTVKCPDCGEVYEDGTQFCDQCGTELPQPEPEFAAIETPGAAPVGTAEETIISPPTPQAVPVPSVQAKLIVTRGAQLGIEYPLVAGNNEIGRWDDEAGAMPHIDLDAQDEEGYVHRRHAMIRFDGSQWWVEHLKEPPSNPTRIRGRGDKLQVGHPVRLQDGDEIAVGRVILKFVAG